MLTPTAILALAAVWLTATPAEGSQLEPQLKLLVNDEALLLQQPEDTPAASGDPEPRADDDDPTRRHYDSYRSSELRRLSYETIHRILRDENEPNYRREEAEMHYYAKRSYEPTHEVFRRAALEQQPPHLLNLTRSNLTVLPAAASAGDYQQVRVVDLSANALTDANLTLFPQLQWADLSSNALTSLPLTANSTLTSLNLNANRITSGIVSPHFSHVQQLHLSGNRIDNLSTLNLSSLQSVQTLDLSCNLIRNVDTAFFPQRMHNLKFLNLARNQLGCIYRETFYNLLSLNTLVLAQNNITDIDYESFLALPNLQYLDLSHNQLKAASIRALQGIPDLVGLSIAYNPQLGASLQEFVASWSLKELDASGTGLCQIPAALAQSVRTLKLADNWLKIINCGDLDSYPLLQYLDLSRSRIEDIEEDALGRLEILEVLFLDHNNLRQVPLSLPTSLRHLFLQHNQVMDIQVQAFQGLSSLQTLDLSHNRLLYLPALPLPRLLTLNLQSSQLRGVSQAIVHTLPRLRDMLLEDNPVKCSDLLGIAEWASACRVAERAGKEERVARTEGRQLEAAKVDLKQQFVRMHNFLENFRSDDCAADVDLRSTRGEEQAQPACAVELEADAERAEAGATAAGAAAAASTTPDSPTEPQTSTAAARRSARNNEIEATSDLPRTTTGSNLADVIAKTAATAATAATTALRASATPTTFSSVDSKLPARPTTSAKASDTQDAQQVGRGAISSSLINSRDAKTTATTTTTTTSATTLEPATAINSEQQHREKEAATITSTSTSTLNECEVAGFAEGAEAAAAATAAATAIPETTRATPIYTRLPQTIPTAIESTNNYVETVTGSSSRHGLSAPAAAASAKTAGNEANNNSISRSEVRQAERRLQFNGASGQPQVGAEPTAGDAISANDPREQQQQQQQGQQHHSASSSGYKREPQQLPITDRHLIGTPLLVYRGLHILDEPKQLMLPATPATAAATTEATTARAKTEAAASADAHREVAAVIGSRSAQKLAASQKSTEVKERHLLATAATERDKLPATEAMKTATNEPNVDDKQTTRREELSRASGSESGTRAAHAATQPPKTQKASAGKRKLVSLTMKRMTITKQPATSAQNGHHHPPPSLNKPRENEAAAVREAGLLAERHLFKESQQDNRHIRLPLKQHNTVNMPVDVARPRHAFRELPHLAAIEQQPTAVQHHASISKSEQWLDIRKAQTSSGHPGLVILVSLVAFVVLLLGLIQVYRCDRHWRRRQSAPRPHLRQLKDEGSGSSFLSYHSQQSRPSNTPHKWLHSTRLLPPQRSPLHNLHVRELQKHSAVELQQSQAAGPLRSFDKSASSRSSSTDSSASSCSSHSSHMIGSQYAAATGALMQHDAFFVEMTPDSGRPACNPHSDLLPMELLTVSANRRPTTTATTSSEEVDLLVSEGRATRAAPADAAGERTRVCQNHSAAASRDIRLPLVKLAPTSRKFGLW